MQAIDRLKMIPSYRDYAKRFPEGSLAHHVQHNRQLNIKEFPTHEAPALPRQPRGPSNHIYTVPAKSRPQRVAIAIYEQYKHPYFKDLFDPIISPSNLQLIFNNFAEDKLDEIQGEIPRIIQQVLQAQMRFTGGQTRGFFNAEQIARVNAECVHQLQTALNRKLQTRAKLERAQRLPRAVAGFEQYGKRRLDAK